MFIHPTADGNWTDRILYIICGLTTHHTLCVGKYFLSAGPQNRESYARDEKPSGTCACLCVVLFVWDGKIMVDKMHTHTHAFPHSRRADQVPGSSRAHSIFVSLMEKHPFPFGHIAQRLSNWTTVNNLPKSQKVPTHVLQGRFFKADGSTVRIGCVDFHGLSGHHQHIQFAHEL